MVSESKPTSARRPKSRVSKHGSKDIGQKVIYVDRSKILLKGKRALPIIYAHFRETDGILQADGDAAEIYIDGPCTIVFAPEREVEMGGVRCWVQMESSVNIITDSDVFRVR